jgi:bifunctional enzyme CysN/CysC
MLRFLTSGSVDDGKSTFIGRLLYESDGVFQDQLESVHKASATGPGIDFSLITDGLKAEREQAITIDVAYRYFSTAKRKFIVADTPGHAQYTRNMVTGASTADLSVLLVDARKGLLEQTVRHAHLIHLLGIRRFIVAINKMDLVDFDEQVFNKIKVQFQRWSDLAGGVESYFVPVSALHGDNVVRRSEKMPWYQGMAVLDLLETIPIEDGHNFLDFRFPVQIVIRQHEFRGYAGQVASGLVRKGQEVLALPSGQTSRIEEISICAQSLDEAVPTQSVVLSLSDQIDLSRGDMLVDPQRPPFVDNRFIANVIWMSQSPLQTNLPFLIKHCTQTLCCCVLGILHRFDFEKMEEASAEKLCLNDLGRVEIQTHRQIFFDPYASNRSTGSFIIVDSSTNNTVGAGIIIGPSSAAGSSMSVANFPSNQTGQHPRGLTVWLTGLSGAGKTTIASTVCTELLARGLRVEMLDGDVIRKLFSSDLGFSRDDRNENIRRIGLIAELLTRNGAIVLVSAISPYREAREEIRGKICDFVEVYVNAPLDICEQRDVKGLYKKARAGKIAGFTGVDDPYEPPRSPEIECNTDQESVRASVDKVVSGILDFLGRNPQAHSPGSAF